LDKLGEVGRVALRARLPEQLAVVERQDLGTTQAKGQR
jgi:hypothetical protein